MVTVTYDFSVRGVHCASSGPRIDEHVGDVPGVISSQTSPRMEWTTVRADPWCTPEAVLAAIIEAGYTAELVQP